MIVLEGRVGLALGSGSARGLAQHRITRSRLAGDKPDPLITLRLSDFGHIEFDRAAEAIDEGRRAVARALSPAALGLQEAP
jgi:NTE family protein